MKKFIRIIALVMALLTMSGLFAACANTQTAEETTDGAGVAETEAPVVETTAEETLYAPDDLKEKYDFNETVTIFMWSDYSMMEFYAEETGDIIDDAIFNRNVAVETRLGVEFDLWKGEADAKPYIADMVEYLKKEGYAHEDQGALVVDVKEETDTKEIPPCMILKSDGASLYNTTDLATIMERMKEYAPDKGRRCACRC